VEEGGGGGEEEGEDLEHEVLGGPGGARREDTGRPGARWRPLATSPGLPARQGMRSSISWTRPSATVTCSLASEKKRMVSGLAGKAATS